MIDDPKDKPEPMHDPDDGAGIEVFPESELPKRRARAKAREQAETFAEYEAAGQEEQPSNEPAVHSCPCDHSEDIADQ
jgi:hypothetical protein